MLLLNAEEPRLCFFLQNEWIIYSGDNIHQPPFNVWPLIGTTSALAPFDLSNVARVFVLESKI